MQRLLGCLLGHFISISRAGLAGRHCRHFGEFSISRIKSSYRLSRRSPPTLQGEEISIPLGLVVVPNPGSPELVGPDPSGTPAPEGTGTREGLRGAESRKKRRMFWKLWGGWAGGHLWMRGWDVVLRRWHVHRREGWEAMSWSGSGPGGGSRQWLNNGAIVGARK